MFVLRLVVFAHAVAPLVTAQVVANNARMGVTLGTNIGLGANLQTIQGMHAGLIGQTSQALLGQAVGQSQSTGISAVATRGVNANLGASAFGQSVLDHGASAVGLGPVAVINSRTTGGTLFNTARNSNINNYGNLKVGAENHYAGGNVASNGLYPLGIPGYASPYLYGYGP